MPGVGAKGMSWKKAMADAKKKNPQNVREAAGPSPREEDRSPNEIPLKRLNYFNYGQPVKRYNDAASAFPKKDFKEIIQEKAKDPNNKGAQALAPLLRFCGGKSKPYKKK